MQGQAELAGDIRDESQVAKAVEQTAERFGGIDLCINNASALNIAPIADLPVKRYDLLQSVNVRGTFVVTQVRQVLQQAVAAGANSPYFVAACVIGPFQKACMLGE